MSTAPHDLKKTLAKMAAQEEPRPFGGGLNVSGSLNTIYITGFTYAMPKATTYTSNGWTYKPIASTP